MPLGGRTAVAQGQPEAMGNRCEGELKVDNRLCLSHRMRNYKRGVASACGRPQFTQIVPDAGSSVVTAMAVAVAVAVT